MSEPANLNGCAGPARVSLTNSGPGQSSYQVHDEDVVAATVDCLNRLGVKRRSGVGDEPFSISVGLMLPHQPFVARREDYELYAGRMTMPRRSASAACGGSRPSTRTLSRCRPSSPGRAVCPRADAATALSARSTSLSR